MNTIYDKINAKTSGKYAHLRFSSVTFKDSAVVTVVCKKSGRASVDANKSELYELIKAECAFNTPITLEICDEPPTPKTLRETVVDFTQKFKYVSSVIHTIAVRADENAQRFTVTLKMPNIIFELAKNDYIPRLEEYLLNKYAEPIKVNVVSSELAGSGEESGGEVRGEYEISDVVPVIGNFAPKTARSVSSLTESGYNVAVCGIFVMPTAFTSKGGRRYERFLLYDGQTSVQCRFSPDGGRGIVDCGLINKPVCVLGNVEYDKMRNEATVFVRELSRCGADIKSVPSPECPKDYDRVTPTSHAEFVQSSMFDRAETLPSALKGSFVVFDFETTGLSVLYDRPTEIGAVKIVDGKITETFSTLIDPRRPIPPDVSAKTGITDDMVKGQPLFEDVVPDFYKFTYGCSLVCHNIAFDFPFLLKGGNGIGYAFGDRATFDTMAIAPTALPGISRLSLDCVLDALGLTNDSAHRALSDAVATAKAFIAMHKILDGKR